MLVPRQLGTTLYGEFIIGPEYRIFVLIPVLLNLFCQPRVDGHLALFDIGESGIFL